MEKKKTIVVIGAGLAGLSAGIYLLRSGYKVILLERNPSVGGLCTGWYRKGRYVDGCIHWLTGTKEGDSCNHIWKDIGAFEDQDDLIYLDTWGNFEYEGQTIRLLRDYKKAEQEWLAISPEDSKEIKRFFKMVEAFIDVKLPLDRPASMLPLSSIMKVAGSLIKHPSYLTTMKMSTSKYAERFKNPAIRFAIKNAQPGPGNLFSMLFSYSTIAGDTGAVPIGGSKPMVERIKNRFIRLDGTLILNADVVKINTKKAFATDVVLKNGQIIKGDYFVSTVAPNYTLDVLLNGKYKSRLQARENYHKHPSISTVMVTYEIEDIGDLDSITTFPIEPINILGKEHDFLDIRNFNYDPKNFVKDNKTVCNSMFHLFDEDYLAWEKLYQNKAEYRQEKERIANEVVDRIEKQYPQYKGKITVLDVFTPMTLKRYTNAPRGAYMSLFTDKQARISHSGVINGLDNLYLAGQWLESPGGLPFAAASGKWAAIRICKQDRVTFDVQASAVYKKATI